MLIVSLFAIVCGVMPIMGMEFALFPFGGENTFDDSTSERSRLNDFYQEIENSDLKEELVRCKIKIKDQDKEIKLLKDEYRKRLKREEELRNAARLDLDACRGEIDRFKLDLEKFKVQPENAIKGTTVPELQKDTAGNLQEPQEKKIASLSAQLKDEQEKYATMERRYDRICGYYTSVMRQRNIWGLAFMISAIGFFTYLLRVKYTSIA